MFYFLVMDSSSCSGPAPAYKCQEDGGPRDLSSPAPRQAQAVSSQRARKSQGLLRGGDHQALSWPEAARLPAPLRAGVPERQWPLGGLGGTRELLGQSVAVWGREVGKALPLGTEPLAKPLPSLGLVSHCLPVPGRSGRGQGHSLPLSPESQLRSRRRPEQWRGVMPRPRCLPG